MKKSVAAGLNSCSLQVKFSTLSKGRLPRGSQGKAQGTKMEMVHDISMTINGSDILANFCCILPIICDRSRNLKRANFRFMKMKSEPRSPPMTPRITLGMIPKMLRSICESIWKRMYLSVLNWPKSPV